MAHGKACSLALKPDGLQGYLFPLKKLLWWSGVTNSLCLPPFQKHVDETSPSVRVISSQKSAHAFAASYARTMHGWYRASCEDHRLVASNFLIRKFVEGLNRSIQSDITEVLQWWLIWCPLVEFFTLEVAWTLHRNIRKLMMKLWSWTHGWIHVQAGPVDWFRGQEAYLQSDMTSKRYYRLYQFEARGCELWWDLNSSASGMIIPSFEATVSSQWSEFRCQ